MTAGSGLDVYIFIPLNSIYVHFRCVCVYVLVKVPAITDS